MTASSASLVTPVESLLRRALLALAAVSIAATAVELAAERHWKTWIQDIPWVGLAILAVALVLLLANPRRATVQGARVLAAAVVVFAIIGVYKHVEANHDAGPLDFRYSETWDSMGAASRWWKAASGGVGPSPVIAPLALANGAILVVAATLRHPALGHRST